MFAASVVTVAFLTGCTIRSQAPTSITAHDFSDHDAYGQAFAVSPTFQDTSWTTSAPARTVAGYWHEKAEGEGAAPANAKGADEGAGGKLEGVSAAPTSAPVARPTPVHTVPRQTSTPVQGGQSTALPGSSTTSR